MKDNVFAISDIHGQYTYMMELLKNWDKEMKLVIIGDCIDRGEDSSKVVVELMKLKQHYGDQIILIKGNHEDMLMKFLDDPTEENGQRYFRNGGDLTIKQFTGLDDLSGMDYPQIAELMSRAIGKTNYLKELKLYYEYGNILFIHAGIDPALSDWRDTDPHKMVWIRGNWEQPNKTGKVIVFGHTPTQEIHTDRTNGIWLNEKADYIDIDGGSVYGGQLNAVILNKQGQILQTFSVESDHVAFVD
ncbi:metallophosphoesterase family protein [Bacillus sp. 1P06AnD]|uniref:metallophosphoesterase family protein n=1 Tax=Bacillus sp. 1P06AnD TaxID=3132208 RepID=UPI0039A1EBEC